MPNYTVTNPVFSGNTQQVTLTDIDTNSKIDVLKMLGKPAKKILIELSNGDSVSLRINAATRATVPFTSGTVDIDGNTSTLPRVGYWDSNSTPPKRVPGADNRCDAVINRWSSSGGLAISETNSSGSAIVYNSYENYGDLVINNIAFGTIIAPSSAGSITVTFVA